MLLITESKNVSADRKLRGQLIQRLVFIDGETEPLSVAVNLLKSQFV